MTKPLATATYNDIWAGTIGAHLEGFRTKRRGETVTLYRWKGERGIYIHHWRAPFTSVERALQAARHHAAFANVAA